MCIKIWMVLLVSLAMMPPTTSEKVDCSGVNTSDSVADTCTVQLTLSDREMEVTSSLAVEYQDFPMQCRYGKQAMHLDLDLTAL